MDLTYRLVVDMGTRGSLEPALGRVGSAAGNVDRSIGSLKGSLGGLSDTFVSIGDRVVDIGVGLAKVGAVAAGGAIAYGVAGLNAQLETTKMSLGGILNAQGMSNGLSDGLDKAGGLMKDMRKDAAALPGEFKDLLGIFRMSATPGFQAGASITQLEKLSANTMAASAALQVPMEQAAREMGMLLQGRAGAHNVLGNLLGLTGDAAEKFNKSSGSDRLKTLEMQVGKYAGLNDVFARSYDAISSSLVDNAKLLLGTATSGVFERVKSVMGSANDWFDTNHDKAIHFAEAVSDKLVYGFEFGRMKLLEWWPVLEKFAANARQELHSIWATAGPFLARFEGLAKQGLASGGLFKGLEGAGLAYAGLKVGGMAAPMVSPLVSGMAGALGIGELGAAAGVALPILIAVAGAIHVLADETSFLHDTAATSMHDATQRMGSAGEHLASTWARVEGPVVRIAEVAGTVLIVQLDALAGVLQALAYVADAMVTEIGKSIEKGRNIAGITDEDWNFMKSRVSGAAAGAKSEAAAKKTFEDAVYAGGSRVENDKRTKSGAGGGGGGAHIAKVEIVVSGAEDPERVARLTVDRLLAISRNPLRSPGDAGPLRR